MHNPCNTLQPVEFICYPQKFPGASFQSPAPRGHQYAVISITILVLSVKENQMVNGVAHHSVLKNNHNLNKVEVYPLKKILTCRS